MADAVGLWVIVYFCVTSVNTKDTTNIFTTTMQYTQTDFYSVVM